MMGFGKHPDAEATADHIKLTCVVGLFLLFYIKRRKLPDYIDFIRVEAYNFNVHFHF